jgi:basic amino acid/polyamine antiporter, APA family
LSAFALVSAGVLVLRYTEPERPRPFRVPWAYVVAPLSVVLCVYVMLGLPLETWIRFSVWLAIGLALYFMYGYQHSRIRQGPREGGGGPS